MSKACVNSAKSMLEREDVTFYHDLALEVQKAMEDDVAKAMKVFAKM